MNDAKKIPWLNIWMLVFAAFGLWLTFIQPRTWYEFAVVAILLLSIAIIAIRSLPGSNGTDEVKTHRYIVLTEIGGIYLTAWKQLWGQKWLRLFFGILFMVMLLGGLLEHILLYYYVGSHAADLMPDVIKNPQRMDSLRFMSLFLDSMIYVLREFNSFIQIPGTMGSSIIAYITLAVVAIIIYPGLKKLYDDPEYSKGAHVIRSIIIPFIIISLTLAALMLIAAIRQFSALGNMSNMHDVIPKSLSILTIIGAALFIFLADSAVFSGFVGSLVRMSRREAVNIDTFIKDIIGYIKPVALLYLLLFVLLFIVSGPYSINVIALAGGKSSTSLSGLTFLIIRILNALVYIALMFAPFAIVCKMQGVKQGIKDGLMALRKNIGEVTVFIALGLTFLTTVEMSKRILGIILPGNAYTNQMNSLISGIYTIVVTVIVTAVMVLAIWNLYLRFETCPNPDDDTEQSVPSPE
ncbi:MAG: hypothetical protein ACYC27_17290 [Armatimonadota bacterium]